MSATPTQIVHDDPLPALRRYFGMDAFRSGQRDVIDRLLAGKNVAAVFPTGGGKSLCYQLPSQMMRGTTVVVSPLIALMKDQCDSMAQRGIAAARLDSSLSQEDYRKTMDGIHDGSIRLLYVAPERFFNERFLATIGNLNIALFAIDEAHCISQWGHNFRPDYLKLAALTQRLDVQRVLALTATATPEVLRDIRDAFAIDEDDAIRTPFYRPNLHLRSTVVSPLDHYPTLLSRLRDRAAGATLIYVTLQKTAEEIAERLRGDGIDAFHYHAGMKPEERAQVQQDFIKSTESVIVATIAFGMGIDKSNLRYVYHYNPPKSLESYAQEIGRAGRDGRTAICEVLLCPNDRTVLENFVFGDTPTLTGITSLLQHLLHQPDSFFISQYAVANDCDIRQLVLRTLLTYLELDGYIAGTSPRYDTYEILPHTSSKTILAHFDKDPDRREFISGILCSLSKGRKWFRLNMPIVVRRLGDRERIVSALNYMEQKGWIEMKVKGLMHGYRWLKRIDDPNGLACDLYNRLEQRESGEIARMDEVFELVAAQKCQAQTLSRHFGDAIESCGDCTHCRGEGPHEIPSKSSFKSIGSSALTALRNVMREQPELLETPRAQARFLCGLTSPAFTRARLSRHESFGICESVPFQSVLRELSDG